MQRVCDKGSIVNGYANVRHQWNTCYYEFIQRFFANYYSTVVRKSRNVCIM